MLKKRKDKNRESRGNKKELNNTTQESRWRKRKIYMLRNPQSHNKGRS